MITFKIDLQEMFPPTLHQVTEDLLHKNGPLGNFHPG